MLNWPLQKTYKDIQFKKSLIYSQYSKSIGIGYSYGAKRCF